MLQLLSRAVQRYEDLESLQVFGLLRLGYAVVWLWYRHVEEVAHPTSAPHLMGHPDFLFSHNRLLMRVHAVSSAVLLPFVAGQVFGRKGTSAHTGSGRLVTALVIVTCPFNVALLCQNRYAWWLTTLVETLVLTQWLYHLAKLCATTGASHRWHGLQFVRMWLTPVDVRVATSLAFYVGTKDPVVATVFGHVGALALWIARLSPRPQEAAHARMPHVAAPRLAGFDVENLPAFQASVLTVAHLLVGSEAPVDEVRTVAHGRPTTLLVIIVAAVFAFLGGLQLLSLWSEGDLGDWDWKGLAYVLPLVFATLQFSDRFYDGDPVVRLALPVIVLLSISPPFAVEGLFKLARDLKQAVS